MIRPHSISGLLKTVFLQNAIRAPHLNLPGAASPDALNHTKFGLPEEFSVRLHADALSHPELATREDLHATERRADGLRLGLRNDTQIVYNCR